MRQWCQNAETWLDAVSQSNLVDQQKQKERWSGNLQLMGLMCVQKLQTIPPAALSSCTCKHTLCTGCYKANMQATGSMQALQNRASLHVQGSPHHK